MTGNLADLLAAAATTAPDRVALVEAGSGRTLTWRELDAEVDAVAAGLTSLGLVAGYRVMVALPNRIEFVTTYLAALRSRLVHVPVNPGSATGELVRMMADSGARAVVADASTLAGVRSAAAGLDDALTGADPELQARAVVPHVVAVGAPTLPGETSYDALRSAELAVDAPVAADPEALAVLLYTSGTSGRPRAAMLSHRALLANIEQAAAVEPPMVRADDVVLGVLPLFHVYGLNGVLGAVLRHAATLLVVDGFDPERALDQIRDHAATVVPVAPAVFGYWREVEGLSERLSGVRLVLSGSAPLSPDLVDEFTERTGLPLHQGYGLTEAAPAVTSTLCSVAPKRGSVGAALPGIRIRVVDETFRQPEGEDPGEIQVAGDNLFSGYWPDGSDGPDEEGWYSTGDIGFVDPDGELFLVDRLKELVIVSGFNVYPSEVEDVIAELDAVGAVAVIGAPDDRSGEAVVAYVVPSAGSSLTYEELESLVRRTCAERLARFKQPQEVHVVPELPYTPTGKVAKGRLRATLRRRELGLLE